MRHWQICCSPMTEDSLTKRKLILLLTLEGDVQVKISAKEVGTSAVFGIVGG